MKQTYMEIFRKFYGATVGRFYSEDQKRKLLILFAASCGIDEELLEYDYVIDAMKTVSAQGITDYVDSCNYRLVCNMSEDNIVLQCAAEAIADCYELRERTRAPIYTQAADWRIAVFTAPSDDIDAQMERAYIEYACENIDFAIDIWKKLAFERGSYAAVEYLAFISCETANYGDALLYLELLNKISVKELHMMPESWIAKTRNAIVSRVPAKKIEEVNARVQRQAPMIVNQMNERRIGFATDVGGSAK